MRLIGQLADRQQIEKFVAYLLVQGIETQVDPEGDAFDIWVKDEDRFKEAMAELDSFKANVDDSKYLAAVAEARTIVKAEEKRRQQTQKNMVRVGARGVERRIPITVGMTIICILVWVYMNAGDPDSNDPLFQAMQFVSAKEADVAALNPPIESIDDLRLRLYSVSQGQIWRVVTPIFIHFGVMHIVFNLYMFCSLGAVLERKYGSPRFLGLILIVAILSNLVQCTVPDQVGGSVPSRVGPLLLTHLGGMSGVVYGLFGFVWMKSIYDRSFGFGLAPSSIIILVGWLFFCMLPVELRAQIGFPVNVANWAHGIGLAVGMAIGYYTSKT